MLFDHSQAIAHEHLLMLRTARQGRRQRHSGPPNRTICSASNACLNGRITSRHTPPGGTVPRPCEGSPRVTTGVARQANGLTAAELIQRVLRQTGAARLRRVRVNLASVGITRCSLNRPPCTPRCAQSRAVWTDTQCTPLQLHHRRHKAKTDRWRRDHQITMGYCGQPDTHDCSLSSS